jgi:hypothetical protein
LKIPKGGNRKSKKNRQHNAQKKKVENEKQRSTKHTHKTEDRVTRTSLDNIICKEHYWMGYEAYS